MGSANYVDGKQYFAIEVLKRKQYGILLFSNIFLKVLY